MFSFRAGLLALAALSLALTTRAQAGFTVYNSGNTPYGNTNVLNSQFWQYAYSVPSAQSPFLDQTGANAYFNNNGPVFFLAGQFSLNSNPLFGIANRTITIPYGTPIYFPILNVEADNIGQPAFGQPLLSTAGLRSLNDGFISLAQNMFATIDGVPVTNITTQHFDNSPTPFDIKLPDNNLYQYNGFNGTNPDPTAPGGVDANVPGGTYLANAVAFPFGNTPPGFLNSPVAEGYYVLIGGLTPGHHTIDFGGSYVDPVNGPFFTLQIHYDVNVIVPAPEPATLALWGIGLGSMVVVGRWRRNRLARRAS